MSLSFPPSPRLNKMMLSDIFHCRSGYRQRKEFFKTDSESLFPDGSGHIFNFCIAPTRLENGGTDPRGFAVAEIGFCRSKTSRISVATF
jgi:hypothetical protein